MSRRIALSLLAAALPCTFSVVSCPPAARGDAARTDAHEALVELGRRLFFDPVIGRAGRVACAACHDPEHGFSDARVQSIDETGPLPRHSQPLADLAGRGFHWDGEFDTVREIVEARVLPRDAVAVAGLGRAVARAETAAGGGEEWDRGRLTARATSSGLQPAYYGDPHLRVTAASDESPVDQRLADWDLYGPGLAAAFGDRRPTAARVVDAVDAYVRSIRTSDSPFDRFARGDETALGPAARRGRDLFAGKAGCVQCHPTTSDHGRARLTDGAFHDTGIAWDPAADALRDRGNGAVDLRPGDDGRFKTPSLRDVARRAPYMHDGRFATLAEVVRYYDGGGTPHAALDPRIRKLGLTEDESADVVAFLESLSGDERAGLGRPAANRPPRLRVRVVDMAGRPRRDLDVVFRPAGDRLAGAAADATQRLRTGADGSVTVAWPATTHLAVEFEDLPGVRVPLVPDWTSALDVIAPEYPADHPVLAVPPSILDGIDVVDAVPLSRAGTALTLTRVFDLRSGRAAYVCDVPARFIRGCYTLTPSNGTRVIGVYEPAKWFARPDDLRRRVDGASAPSAVVGQDLRDRLERVLRAPAPK